MILQALTEYYETLLEKGKIARPGWGTAKVSFALELDGDGQIIGVHSLKTEPEAGKKQSPKFRNMEVPMPEKRSSGILADFLCDNSAYILGSDAKGKPERAVDCFVAARARHLEILSDVDSPAAGAVRSFFAGWNPGEGKTHPMLAPDWDELISGGNFLLFYDRRPVTDDPAIRAAWQNYYDNRGDGPVMQCLVTGKESPIPNTHPAIKGVRGAQSSGAALVSFNTEAAESYNRKQNLNAPVGAYAAFAYTTALNTLLADREHTQVIGDTTVVCWAKNGESGYQDFAMESLMGISPEEETQNLVRSTLEALAQGKKANWNGEVLSPDADFYILGLAPNAARLSVRFFLHNTFAEFMKRQEAHFVRLEIVRPSYDKWESLPLWKLVGETVRDQSPSKAQPQMAGDTLRAILAGDRYPATLLNGVMLRIRAEREVTRGRAAIIKAYYLRNTNQLCPEEVLTVTLNETTQNVPYTLGRMFSVLEAIQQAANPGINTTIKDKYYTSAAATPATIFPILLNLSQKHLRKLDTGIRIHWEKRLGELAAIVGQEFPARLALPEQGSFHLGYYHQTQKRYEKKEEK